MRFADDTTTGEGAVLRSTITQAKGSGRMDRTIQPVLVREVE